MPCLCRYIALKLCVCCCSPLRPLATMLSEQPSCGSEKYGWAVFLVGALLLGLSYLLPHNRMNMTPNEVPDYSYPLVEQNIQVWLK